MNNSSLEKRVSGIFEEGYFTAELKAHIKANLNTKLALRPYQIEAFRRFDWATGNNLKQQMQRHLLFHMATGSGKTLIMAGLILDLYARGYRNFIFFVNSTTIIDKTKDNFLNPVASKYLFNDELKIGDKPLEVKEVANFEAANDEAINIVFTTIQGLHTTLNTPRENSLTYEDFEDQKIVLLSDEAHHINAETKRKNAGQFRFKKPELDSWEATVERIFKSNEANYLLEFTATANLKHPAIKAKYADKLLVDYPLEKFRDDKYSKDVQVLQADLQPFERALQAVLLSQYRQKVFQKNQLHRKPVILFKSKTIKESQDFYKTFGAGIRNLTVGKLEQIQAGSSNMLIDKVFNYFDKHKIPLENLVLELQSAFSEQRCIAVDSKHDSEAKQLIVNSLEDENNAYRAVFAVDKLNEGWDVLNLFDIVRLYNTRDTDHKKGKIGKTTMSEAQLIGRGARYCPFQISDDQDPYRRKYDADIGNDLRICEELYYHSAHNPRYISELNKALIQTGIVASNTVQKRLILKDTFKQTKFYKSGFIYVNTRKANDRKNIHALAEPIRTKIYTKNFRTGKASVSALINEKEAQQLSSANRIHALNRFSEALIRKALNKLPFYRFSNLKRYFPHLSSMSEFIKSDNYLNTLRIELAGPLEQVKKPTNAMKLAATVSALEAISKSIQEGYVEFEGTKKFRPKQISGVFGKDEKGKILNFALNEGSEKELGRGQTETPNQALYLDLSQEDWYVFNDNYGTSEEKYLVKYLKTIYESLAEKYEVYLIRNQRHFKIYTFQDGKPFEPDFVLFLIDRNTNEPLSYQLFIEPKGGDRLTNDDSKAKEKFLKQIKDEYILDRLYENEAFKLIGMPLYNNSKTKRAFDEKLKGLFKP